MPVLPISSLGGREEKEGGFHARFNIVIDPYEFSYFSSL